MGMNTVIHGRSTSNLKDDGTTYSVEEVNVTNNAAHVTSPIDYSRTQAEIDTYVATLGTGDSYLARPSDGANAGNLLQWNGSSMDVVEVGGAASTYEAGVIAGERNPDSATGYLAAVPECNYASVTADTDVSSSAAGLLLGVLVTAATATNVIEIRDANAAGAGTVVLSIPASTAAGTFYDLKGAKLNTGIYADFTGTGTIVVLWRAQ